jgi:pyroglutamyl-peptidase
MKILLTGFEAFGSVSENPSQRVVEHFMAKPLAAEQQVTLITAVLPVDYAAASHILPELLAKHRPDAVLMLGVAQMRDSINLERIALNINDAKIADNAGNQKSGQPIVDDAPVAYRSTLPLEAMYTAIQSAGIAVTYSNHAGAYLCNHVFYLARHSLECAGLGHIPCGFIHLPDMGQESPKMPLEKIIRAVRLALGVLSTKESFSEILKRLEEKLPERPDWIVLSSTDGFLMGGVNVDTSHEERNPSPYLTGMYSISERVSDALNLGAINFLVNSSSKGLVLVVPLHDDYFLGLKFGKEIEYARLAEVGNSLPAYILGNLSKMLIEKSL